MGSAGATAVLLSCVVLSMLVAGSAGATAVLLSCVVLSMLVAGSAASDKPLVISRAALEAVDGSSARRLMVGEAFCPIRFDHMQKMGKIQTSCIGQAIPSRRCCSAFKNFVCPYGDEVNDVENGCAAEMLMRIHQLCQVPSAYFVMCGDSAQGITC